MNISKPERTLRRILAISALDGWSLAALGGMSVVLCLVFQSWLGIAIGGAILGGGVLELAGRKRLVQGVASGVNLMAGAQVIVVATISAYALRNLVVFNADTVSSALSPEIRELFMQYGLSEAEMRAMLAPLYKLTYAIVLVLTVVFQGGLALYYLARRNHVTEALEARRAAKVPPPLPDV